MTSNGLEKDRQKSDEMGNLLVGITYGVLDT